MQTTWMKELAETGQYDARRLLPVLNENFWAAFADDRATEEEIRAVYACTKYTVDPHTAVAYRAAESYRRTTGDERPMIVLSTASPYKFAASVLRALGEDAGTLDAFAQMERLQSLSRMDSPPRLAALRTMPVLHDGICARAEMRDAVLAFAGRNRKEKRNEQ